MPIQTGAAAMPLPKQYSWLAKEPGPRILLEALKVYGVSEKPGPGSNPSIMEWARATGQAVYRSDDMAWCGLFMAYVALQSGWDLPVNPLAARNWLNWGVAQDKPGLGDVLIFWRGSLKGFQGHVNIYVSEDREAYHGIGGNQGDAVTIKRISKSRLLGIRRCPWRVNEPANIRRVFLSGSGPISTNEG